MTDADLATLLRPIMPRILATAQERLRASQTATFSADSDDSPLFKPSFARDDISRLSDYFHADEKGWYLPTLHRRFGLSPREFADAAGMRQVYVVGGDGKGVLYWAKREQPKAAFSTDASGHEHKGKGEGGGQFVKGSGGGGGESGAANPAHDPKVKGPNPALPDHARPDLDPAEQQAVAHYSGGGYGDINKLLRGQHAEDPEIARSAHDHLQQAFGKAKPFEKPVTTYRALQLANMDEDTAAAFLKNLDDAQKTGAPVTLPGYTSTTTDKAWVDRLKSSDTVLEIVARKGLDVKPYAKKPHEQELLLDHNSRFRVVEHRTEEVPSKWGAPETKRFIKLEQVPDGPATHAAFSARAAAPVPSGVNERKFIDDDASFWQFGASPKEFADGPAHKPKGPGGGQFVKGSGGGSNSGAKNDTAAPAPSAEAKAAAEAVASELAGGEGGIKAKVHDLALTAAAHAYRFALGATHSKYAHHLSRLLDAVFDTPDDLNKLGYNPGNSSGVAQPGVHDAVRDATGISGHLAAKIAATVLTKVIFHLKDKLKGSASQMADDGDWRDGVADLLCDLFDGVNEACGLPPVEWDDVRAALETVRGAEQFSAADDDETDTFAAATWTQGTSKDGKTQGWVSSGGQFRKNKPAGADKPAPTPKPKKEPKPAPPTKEQKAATKEEGHQATRAELTAAFADPAGLTPEKLTALAAKLKTLSVEQIKAIQAERGIKGGTAKAQRVQKLVDAAKAAVAKKAESTAPVAKQATPEVAKPEPVAAPSQAPPAAAPGPKAKAEPKPKKEPKVKAEPTPVAPAKPKAPAQPAPEPKATLPAGQTPKGELPGGAVVGASKGGELTTHFAPGQPEQQAAKLGTPIISAMRDAALFPEGEDGLIPLGLLVSLTKQNVPGATDTDVLAALSHMRKTRTIQSQALNEVQKLTDGSPGIAPIDGAKDAATATLWDNGRAVHYFQLPRA